MPGLRQDLRCLKITLASPQVRVYKLATEYELPYVPVQDAAQVALHQPHEKVSLKRDERGLRLQ